MKDSTVTLCIHRTLYLVVLPFLKQRIKGISFGIASRLVTIVKRAYETQFCKHMHRLKSEPSLKVASACDMSI